LTGGGEFKKIKAREKKKKRNKNILSQVLFMGSLIKD